MCRDATALDIDWPIKKRVNGVDKLIEWELFSDHLTPTRNQQILNAFFCVSTFLTPCNFNPTVLTKTTPKSPAHYLLKNVEADSIEMVDGEDDNFDLYIDLFSTTPPASSTQANKNKGRQFMGFGGGGSPIGGG